MLLEGGANTCHTSSVQFYLQRARVGAGFYPNQEGATPETTKIQDLIKRWNQVCWNETLHPNRSFADKIGPSCNTITDGTVAQGIALLPHSTGVHVQS